MVMGLHALHQHDPIIIHGNLKPSNVLIDSKGCLRLAEFGLHEVKLISHSMRISVNLFYLAQLIINKLIVFILGP